MNIGKGGIPTQMEVDRLISQISVEPGTFVKYDDIERCIGCRSTSTRFRTITNTWRRRIFREKLLQSVARGGAFCFLTADEAHDAGRLGMRKVGRAAGRLAVRVEAVDAVNLSGERRDRHNLLRREAHIILDAVRQSEKAIAAPKSTVSTRMCLVGA